MGQQHQEKRTSVANITVLAGGVGAARFLRGLFEVVDQAEVTVIVNTADDTVFHGLHISPDVDTVVYTTAGAIDPERGWGLADESWRAMEALGRYADVGAVTWFNLGDQDLATHLWRTGRMHEGASLAQVTGELASSWGLTYRLLPVTNDRLQTIVTTADGDLAFQEYFVRHRYGIAVSAVRFDGAESAVPAPGVIDAINAAERIVIAPSNPLVSIGPLLAVSGVREALIANRHRVTAISPIIAGAALKGPADRMLTELGHEASVVGVAKLYASFVSTLIIDTADATSEDVVRACGVNVIVTDTIMSQTGVGASLARHAIMAT
jgi:LPPG:FO 2-phospho-L-lactate transferase